MPTGLTLNGRPSHPSSRPPTGLLPPGDRPRPPILTQTAKSPQTVLPPTNWSHTPRRPAVPPSLSGRWDPSPCPPTGLTHHSRVPTVPVPPTVPPTGLTLGGRPSLPSQNPPSPWPTGLQPRSLARVPGRFPPHNPDQPRPTGPNSPVPRSRRPSQGGQLVLFWPKIAQVQNFFFRPAAGRPGSANWSGVGGGRAGSCVGRFWVVFPEERRPPARQNPPNSRPLSDQLVSRSGPERDRRWARPFSQRSFQASPP
jgi:hypothetical protein